MEITMTSEASTLTSYFPKNNALPEIPSALPWVKLAVGIIFAGTVTLVACAVWTNVTITHLELAIGIPTLVGSGAAATRAAYLAWRRHKKERREAADDTLVTMPSPPLPKMARVCWQLTDLYLASKDLPAVLATCKALYKSFPLERRQKQLQCLYREPISRSGILLILAHQKKIESGIKSFHPNVAEALKTFNFDQCLGHYGSGPTADDFEKANIVIGYSVGEKEGVIWANNPQGHRFIPIWVLEYYIACRLENGVVEMIRFYSSYSKAGECEPSAYIFTEDFRRSIEGGQCKLDKIIHRLTDPHYCFDINCPHCQREMYQILNETHPTKKIAKTTISVAPADAEQNGVSQ
jgi:hypothetical protein